MNRTLATENLSKLNESGYDNMMSSFTNDTLDSGKLLDSMFSGAFGVINVGYLLLIGGIFYLIWHDHKSLTIPSILLLIFGRVLFTYIPESMSIYAQLFGIIGLATILVKLYRDGRQ